MIRPPSCFWTIRKPDHSKPELRSTIRKPDMSGFRIPTVLCTIHYHTRLAFGYPLCPVVLFAETTKSTLSRRLSLDHRLKRPTTICLLISIYFSARCDVCEVSVGINMPRGCFSFLSRHSSLSPAKGLFVG